MRIDDGYVRGLLEAFEAAEGPSTDIRELESRGYSYKTKAFSFHLQFLYDEGLMTSEVGSGFGMSVAADGAVMWSVIPLRLTSRGHAFLRELRKDKAPSADGMEKRGDSREGPASNSSVKERSEEIATFSRGKDMGQTTKWDFFISHAKEDAEAVAIPLKNALQDKGFTVWFDEDVLTVGDSLRRSIETGLARCRFGIVILSPAFKQKEWPQRELDGLFTREINEGKIILPVWHNLEAPGVSECWPILADKVATKSAGKSVAEIADAIIKGAGLDAAASGSSLREWNSSHHRTGRGVLSEQSVKFRSAFSEAEAVLARGTPDAFDFMSKHAIQHDAAVAEFRHYLPGSDRDGFDEVYKVFLECRGSLNPSFLHFMRTETGRKNSHHLERENMLKATRDLIAFSFRTSPE